MDNTGGGSFTRNRRLESFLDTNSPPNGKQTPKILVREEVVKSPKTDVYVDDDGWISALIACVRIVVCFLSMMVTTFIWSFILLLLVPWPYERIRQGNIYGHVTGRMLMYEKYMVLKQVGDMCCSQNKTELDSGSTNEKFGVKATELQPCDVDLRESYQDTEVSNERAIYICNHASPIDIFLMMWLTPTGTVGIAKKEIIWYPLFGQMYLLANHLRIDRSNPTAAIQSMKEMAHAVVKNNLSLIIFPEGTRSKDGRLLPFKKGFVHLALQTRLPIVPMVFTGTHYAWRKGSLHVRPAPITVKYLRPIKTDDWTDDKVDDYVKLVHDIYVENLPEAQRPLH